MEAIRVAKVDRVVYNKPGLQAVETTLHLTAHHLILKYEDTKGEQETWVPYPIISTVARLPLSLHGQSPLAFRCRTFENFTLVFSRDRDAEDVFESVKDLTVTASVTNMYAFYYQPSPPFDVNDGWSLYSPREEFARMGVGSRTKAWRFTDINKDYSFCPTYPSRLAIPAKISDAVLAYAVKYRSKARIPALVYLHWNNHSSITRCSQPMVGLTNSRSVQDEKLVEAIFQSHHSVVSPYASPPTRSAITSSGVVYGATATNLIIDARPTTNAMANTAKGAGTENMDHYKDARKVYLGVENIHVMRDSLAKVVEALRDADAMVPSQSRLEGSTPPLNSSEGLVAGVLDRQALRRSGWLKHLSALLDGTNIIVRNIHINSSHVLIHCSDGWDRTSQLSSLSQLCLDPFFRTYRGFQVLIEKDWVSFGHKFTDRCGHLSSEKFFLTSSAYVDPSEGQTFLASVQNKFASQSHLKETSPVFHQFLECVRQIQRQFPTRFEFNERFLERLHYHVYSCQFGTFLFNNERERRVAPPPGDPSPSSSTPAYQRTKSVWDLLNSTAERPQYINPSYDPSPDSRTTEALKAGGDMGVLIPDPKDVRFWHELYGRSDDEMNGRVVTSQAGGVRRTGPVDNGVDDPAVAVGPTVRPGSPEPLSSAEGLDADSLGPRSLNPLMRPQSAASGGSAYSLGSSPGSPSSSTSSMRPTVVGGGAGGGGFKSFWGQISSNASAAFSAVQDVYDTATKDLLGAGEIEGAGGSGNGRELRDAGSSSSEVRSVGNLPSAVYESPWATAASTSSREATTSSTKPDSGLPTRTRTTSSISTSKNDLASLEDDPWSSSSAPLKAGSWGRKSQDSSTAIPARSTPVPVISTPHPPPLPTSLPSSESISTSPWARHDTWTSSSPAPAPARTPSSISVFDSAPPNSLLPTSSSASSSSYSSPSTSVLLNSELTLPSDAYGSQSILPVDSPLSSSLPLPLPLTTRTTTEATTIGAGTTEMTGTRTGSTMSTKTITPSLASLTLDVPSSNSASRRSSPIPVPAPELPGADKGGEKSTASTDGGREVDPLGVGFLG